MRESLLHNPKTGPHTVTQDTGGSSVGKYYNGKLQLHDMSFPTALFTKKINAKILQILTRGRIHIYLRIQFIGDGSSKIKHGEQHNKPRGKLE